MGGASRSPQRDEPSERQVAGNVLEGWMGRPPGCWTYQMITFIICGHLRHQTKLHLICTHFYILCVLLSSVCVLSTLSYLHHSADTISRCLRTVALAKT